jgi:hypothetical protein
MDIKQGFLYGWSRKVSSAASVQCAVRALDVAEKTILGVDGAGRVLEIDRAEIDSWIPDAELINIRTRLDLEKRGQEWVTYRNVPTWGGEVLIGKSGRRAVVLSAYGRTHDGKRRHEADVFYEVPVDYAVGLVAAAGLHNHEVEPAHTRHPRVRKALLDKFFHDKFLFNA